MLKQDVIYYLNRIGHHLEKNNQRATINLYGSSVLSLEHNCWGVIKDIDATWEATEDFLLYPLIKHVSINHSLPDKWLNNDVHMVVLLDPEWKKTKKFHNLSVNIPSDAYAAAQCLYALQGCLPDHPKHPPHGKSFDQFKALMIKLNWNMDRLLKETDKFFKITKLPVESFNWADRAFTDIHMSNKKCISSKNMIESCYNI